MEDEHVELNLETIVSAQEIDEVVSQFRLFNRRPSQQQMQKLFREMPKLTEADLVASGHQDDVCPICFNPFLATLAEEEVAHAMDSPAHPVDELGVTKLHNTCGHIFCRKELRVVQCLSCETAIEPTLSIVKWITEGHDSCPSCRRSLVTDEERRGGGVFPRPIENWLRPWVADSNMVARDGSLPAQLPTLAIDSTHALGVENTRHHFTGMYS